MHTNRGSNLASQQPAVASYLHRPRFLQWLVTCSFLVSNMFILNSDYGLQNVSERATLSLFDSSVSMTFPQRVQIYRARFRRSLKGFTPKPPSKATWSQTSCKFVALLGILSDVHPIYDKVPRPYYDYQAGYNMNPTEQKPKASELVAMVYQRLEQKVETAANIFCNNNSHRPNECDILTVTPRI